MTDAPTIRPATPDDRAAIVALWRQAGLVVPWNDPDSDIALCRASPASEIFVAAAGDAVIGVVMVGEDGHRGWVWYLAVAEGRRRGGLGRRLMQHAEAWLAGRGVPKVQLMIRPRNLAVVAFYEALGYGDNDCRVMQRWLRDDAAFRPPAPGGREAAP